MTLCALNISDTTFQSNVAKQGGAVFYDFGRPNFGSNIIFDNNSAEYGPNIASYAVKITMANDSNDNMVVNDLGSSILYDQSMFLSVRDYDNQIMVLNSVNQITLTSINSTIAKVTGYNSAVLRNGTAEFDNFIVSAKPNSKNVIVSASSKAINTAKIDKIFGNQVSPNQISINFRYCKPGERINEDTCSTCFPGTYSLQWSSEQCLQCIDNTVCQGGEEISVNPGYWRISKNSTTIIECLNKDACKGGFIDNSTNPTACAEGYYGNL